MTDTAIRGKGSSQHWGAAAIAAIAGLTFLLRAAVAAVMYETLRR